MTKRAHRRKLNALIVALQADPIWLVEPQYLERLRATIAEFWTDEDSIESFPQAFGFSSGPAQADKVVRIVDGIAVANITGMIRAKPDFITEWGLGVATSDIREQSIAALANNQVQGLMLRIDSSGGQAAGAFAAVLDIRDAAAAASKPVWAYVDGQALSGGYAYAMAARRVLAARSSEVGSIGAYAIHSQYRPEDQTFTVFRYGENKALGLPVESLTDAAKAEWQARIDAVGRKFDATVAVGRNVTEAHVRDYFGQGKVYEADAAQAKNMIDGIASSFQVAMDEMRRALGRGPANSGTGAGATRVASTNHESSKVDAQRATAWTIRGHSMNPKIKAALFAVGLIAAVDAADDVCSAVLTGVFAGKERPKTDDEIVAAIAATTSKPLVAVLGETLKPIAANVREAYDREQSEAKAAARAEEAERIKTVRELGVSMRASAEAIDAAIGEGDTLAAAAKRFAGTNGQKPLAQMTVDESGARAFAADASDALAIRCGLKVDKASDQAKHWGKGAAPLAFLARRSLAAQGQRVDDMADDETIARKALRLNGNRDETLIDGGAYNVPSAFPNVLSGLASKLFDTGVERANATYPLWTGVIAGGLPDLKPAPVGAVSQAYALDEVIGDQDLSEIKLQEELLSTIQVRRYANKFGWTPEMVANDDLNQFVEAMIGFGRAGETTVNLLCLNLLTGNPTLLDGYALYDDTYHGNNITSGAAPSDTQWAAMELKAAKQRPVGGVGYMRDQLKVVLAPSKHKPACYRTFVTFSNLPEMKIAATSDNLGIYRGQVQVAIEPELNAVSEDVYYAMCDPLTAPTIVRAYQRGWGEGARRTQWVDQETGTAWVKYEVRVGAAVKNFRTTVKNSGTGG